MRRNTASAELMGNLLRVIRGDRSMRKIAEKIGCPAATISQVEKGQRALKEPKIHTWANALEVDENYLEMLWHLTQGNIPQVTGEVKFYTNPITLYNIIKKVMWKLAPGEKFEFDVSNIKKESRIYRGRASSIKPMDLEMLIKKLKSPERERVRGYVEAILEKREKN